MKKNRRDPRGSKNKEVWELLWGGAWPKAPYHGAGRWEIMGSDRGYHPVWRSRPGPPGTLLSNRLGTTHSPRNDPLCLEDEPDAVVSGAQTRLAQRKPLEVMAVVTVIVSTCVIN